VANQMANFKSQISNLKCQISNVLPFALGARNVLPSALGARNVLPFVLGVRNVLPFALRARQESDGKPSGGPWCRSALPEILKTSTLPFEF
jgi:hypothetical protein